MTFPDVQRDRPLTAAEVHAFLRAPSLVAHRMQELTDLSFVTDYLLRGSASATGTGSVMVEEDDLLFLDDTPEVVAPGAEYPSFVSREVLANLIAVNKRGFKFELTDEKISRTPGDELRRILTLASNTMIKSVDELSRAVLASKITTTYTGAAWTGASAAQSIIRDTLKACAEIEKLERGYRASSVILTPTAYAEVSAALINANALPRESGNPLLQGAVSFQYLGLDWVKSMYSPFTNPTIVDADNLGGVVSEDIGSPDYAKAGPIEVKTRRTDRDSHEITVRRIAVPYVTGPKAAIQITDTGL